MTKPQHNHTRVYKQKAQKKNDDYLYIGIIEGSPRYTVKQRGQGTQKCTARYFLSKKRGDANIQIFPCIKNERKGLMVLFQDMLDVSLLLMLGTVKKKNLDSIYKTNTRILRKVERRRKTSQGPWEPKNNTAVSSPHYITASDIPDQVLQKQATQKCQQSQTKTAPRKACCLYTTDKKRGNLSRQKAFVQQRPNTNQTPQERQQHYP